MSWAWKALGEVTKIFDRCQEMKNSAEVYSQQIYQKVTEFILTIFMGFYFSILSHVGFVLWEMSPSY